MRDAAASAGLGEVVALESVEERPWGAVFRAVTNSAPLYFKAPGHVGRHEPTIIGDLAPRWPTLVPTLVARDDDRRWILMADHGVPMRQVLEPAAQLAVIEDLLPSYADMQASTTALVPRWLEVGVTDRRVELLPAQLASLLDGTTPIGVPRIDADARAAYAAELPLLTRVCDDLASTPVAAALDHADLHGTNVLVDGADRRLVDWGDCCITHPFCTLFVTYELVVPALPPAEQRPAVLRLRDVHLERWGSTAANREAFGLAIWVAHVIRAVNIAHETFGDTDDQSEIVTLLRDWYAKRSLLARSDDVVQP